MFQKFDWVLFFWCGYISYLYNEALLGAPTCCLFCRAISRYFFLCSFHSLHTNGNCEINALAPLGTLLASLPSIFSRNLFTVNSLVQVIAMCLQRPPMFDINIKLTSHLLHKIKELVPLLVPPCLVPAQEKVNCTAWHRHCTSKEETRRENKICIHNLNSFC